MTNECVSETCFDSGDNKDPLRRHGSAVTATIVSAPASYLPPARANILKIFNGPDTDSGNGSSYEAPIANRTNLFCLYSRFSLSSRSPLFPLLPPSKFEHNNLCTTTQFSKSFLSHQTFEKTSSSSDFNFYLVLFPRTRTKTKRNKF